MRTIRRFMAVLLVIFTGTILTTGQQPVAIAYEGRLTDMEGEIIADKEVRVDFSFLDGQKKKIHSVITDTRVDEFGSFSVNIADIPAWADEEGDYLVNITLYSEDDEDWLMDGKFDLDYTIFVTKENGDYACSVRRFEGLILEPRNEGDLWLFTDLYPFAYLSSKFVISFAEDKNDPAELRLMAGDLFEGWQEGDTTGGEMKKSGGSRTRGVKGGFAVGGYSQDAKKDDK